MGTYVYGITKTEHATDLWNTLTKYGVEHEKQRVGVLEYLYKGNYSHDPKTRAWERAQENKVRRRWANNYLPYIVRWHNGYYWWYSTGAFWIDCNPMPARPVSIKVGDDTYNLMVGAGGMCLEQWIQRDVPRGTLDLVTVTGAKVGATNEPKEG